jgi:hypothetical protein
MDQIDEDWLRDTEAIAESQRCVGKDRVQRLIEVARAAIQLDRWESHPMEPEYSLYEYDKYVAALRTSLTGYGQAQN